MNRLKVTGWCFMLGTMMVLLMNACSKTDDKDATLHVMLKDSPGDFQQVNVQVIDVQINSTANGWQSIPVSDSIYNLLLFQNNAATVLGTGTLPPTKINQIRLILGTQNTVMVDSVLFPLLLSSQDETGLKLNVNQTLTSGMSYSLFIDFNAAASIVEEGNGNYRLKPVLSAVFL